MRSLKYIATALLPVINSAYAGNRGDDGTTIVTQTRTVYFCPIQDFFICDDNVYDTTTIERTGAPSTTTTTATAISTTTTGGPATSSNTTGGPATSTTNTGVVATSTITLTATSTTTTGGPTVINTNNSTITTGGSTVTTHGEPITTTITTRGEPITSIITANGTTITSSGQPVTTTITSHGEPITSVITTGGTTITTNGEPITTTITTGKGNNTVITTISPIPVISTTIISEPTTITSTISNPDNGIGKNTTTTGPTTTTNPDNGTGSNTTTTGSTTSTNPDNGIGKNATTTGPTTTSSVPNYNNGTSSITISSNTTTTGPTTTSSVPNYNNSTSSNATSSSTTTGCFNSTRTAAPYDYGKGLTNTCNKPGSRDLWCDGKTVSDDTEPVYTTGETRRYTLRIGLGTHDGDGSGAIPVFTINGKTPGEPIVANWGDMVEVTVINVMDEGTGPTNATTIHWHGILQHGTNDQDGVPGVTECGIAPGTSRTYTWLASTYGTGWYHGHLLSQYGGGVRGPIIIHGPASSDYDTDMGAVMMDEKFSQSIFTVGKYYSFQRGTLAASNYLLNGKNANRFDANKGDPARWIVKAGKKHLFRIINSSAQTGFVFHIDNHKLTVVSADFVAIQPYETSNLYIHAGQRYNVIVKADQPAAAYDVRAMVQLGCGTDIANRGLGQVNGIMEYEGSCYSVPAVSNFTLDTTGVCKDEPLSKLKPMFSQSAGDSDLFLSSVKNMAAGTVGGAAFNVDGTITPVNRWSLGGETPFTGVANGTAFKGINVTFDTPTLQLLPTVGQYGSAVYGNSVFYNSANQWVYWIIQNAFITSHPMHLHGHDFAILGQEYNKTFTSDMVGDLNFKNPMRRDTALLYGSGTPVQPVSARQPGYTVIGFKTNNPGAWLMHCHIIWHADLGMGIQLIERADEIPNYYGKSEFQSECSAMKAYEAGGPGRFKADYESGLKVREFEEPAVINRRHLEEHKFHGYSHGHAIRHE